MQRFWQTTRPTLRSGSVGDKDAAVRAANVARMTGLRGRVRPLLAVLLCATGVAALPACGKAQAARNRITAVQRPTTTTVAPKRLDPTAGLESASGGNDPLASSKAGSTSGLATGSGGKDPTKTALSGGANPAVLQGGTGTLVGLANAIGNTLTRTWTATYSLSPLILKDLTVTNAPPWQASASTDLAGNQHWVGLKYSTDINAFLAGTSPQPSLRICTRYASGGNWRCHDGTVAEVNDPQTALEVAGFIFSPLGLASFLQLQLANVPGVTTTTTAETVAGRPSTCITWADPTGKVPSTVLCLDAEGIPTKVTGKIGEFPVTAVITGSRPGVDAAIAAPPA